tara:strand:+ start:59 stop:1987 length:1929 start_codon:yes stop_codon:yes gene_type:complete
MNSVVISQPQGLVSTVNSSTTPLSGGATFTGVAEQNFFPDVMASCYADVAGTLYFDFSIDGTNWRTFPSAGFTVSAGIHEFHTAVKGPRHFRCRYINGGGAQATFQLQIYYGTFRQPSAPIGNTISSDADATVIKAVIAGVGEVNAKVTDHYALQVTFPPEGKTAFGEASVVIPQPIVQLSFPYNVNTAMVFVRENQSGSVTQASRQAVISTGAATSSSGEIRSRRPVKYLPGSGVMARFTAVFTAGVANSTQIIGIGNESDGFFFGYNGTAFGILHRKNGNPEVRTLTVSTASSTNENINITLDGVVKAVAVTNSGVITTTVNEIAAGDYSDTGAGWDAYAAGNTVIFKSWNAATHSGTYTLSGATTAVGTFAQNVVGSAPTDTWTAQASWNGDDIFDGNGVSGVTLVPTYGNLFQIKYQWLGYGLITFYMEDPDDGELHLVHALEYSNANTTPSVGDPSLSLMVKATNTTNNSAVIIKTASMAAFVEGQLNNTGARIGVRNTKTTVTTSLLPIISVRANVHFQSKAVQTFARVIRAAFAVEHTKPITIVLTRNGALTAASWSSISSGTSSLQVDTSATAITGGTELFSVPLSKAGQQAISFLDDYFENQMSPGDTITFSAIANSGINGEASVSLKLMEKL